jgi:GntR family transcriptional regulator/MocR family aminotransferase
LEWWHKARVEPLFELSVDLASVPKRETSRALYRQLRSAILDGRLPPGAQLPPTRSSAERFGVSRNTVAEVYARLLSEGFVVGRQGAGTFIANPIPTPPVSAARQASPPPGHRLNPFWLAEETQRSIGFWHHARGVADGGGPGPAIDFRPALIDSRLFPFDLFRQSTARQLRRMENRPATLKSPQGNRGNYHLRLAIRDHIGLTRAVACEVDDILVTSGAQQAFDLLARTLVIPGETVVAIEDPGYPPMRVAFAAAGARVVPVGVDEEGLIVEDLPADAGIICVCPSHQFPLGMSMSPRRRQELLAFARRHGAVIVEDDYDGEFRYDGSPLEALRGGASADLVFYVGTFSKCLLPSLRLGFLVAPDWAMPALTTAKNCLDWHCPIPIQLGVSGFIADGHLTRHVGRMRKIYSERRTAMLGGLARLSRWLEPIPSYYGMHVAVRFRRDMDVHPIVQALAAKRMLLHGLERYYLGGSGPPGLVFGYGTADVRQIEAGLAALELVLRTDPI